MKDTKASIRAEEIRTHWVKNDMLVHHKPGNSRILEAVKKKITSDKKKDDVLQAIDNYVVILMDETYYYDHHWTLPAFLKQNNGYIEFLDEGRIWEDYKARKKKVKKSTVQKANSFNNFKQHKRYSNEELERKLGIRK